MDTFDLGEEVELCDSVLWWGLNRALNSRATIDRKIIVNNQDQYMLKYADGTYSSWIESHQLKKLIIKKFDCECGNKQNPKGQGHSHWCPIFEVTS